MQSGWARIAGVLAVALLAAACNTTGQTAGPLQAGQRTTVAFDSIDGPPPAVFQRLVQKLSHEAEARQVPVVTREGFAPYRIRGYMAVGIRQRQTVVTWVWDVYDSQAGRTLRLSGEEKAGPAGRDAWQAVNDEVLGRIARSGMEQLAVYFRSPDMAPGGSPTIAPAPDPAGPVLARGDDFRPESYGITRRAPDAAPATAMPPARNGQVAQR